MSESYTLVNDLRDLQSTFFKLFDDLKTSEFINLVQEKDLHRIFDELQNKNFHEIGELEYFLYKELKYNTKAAGRAFEPIFNSLQFS